MTTSQPIASLLRKFAVALGTVAAQIAFGQTSGGYVGQSSSSATSHAGSEPVPASAELLAIAFPKAVKGARDGVILVDRNDIHFAPAPSTNGLTDLQELTPLAVVPGDSTHVMLIAERIDADPAGQAQVTHSGPAAIDAYTFSRHNGHYTLDRWKIGFTNAGFSGFVNRTDVSDLTPSARAVSLIFGTCYNGYCGTWVSVLGLARNNVTVWADSLPLSADNLGAVKGCADQHEHALLLSPGCVSVVGTFEFGRGPAGTKPTDLVMRFKRDMHGYNKPSEKKKKASGSYVNSEAVYRVLDGTYKLVRGSNPVPQF